MFTAEAVLFDLDGTLIDSTRVTEECWWAWAEEFGVPAERLRRAHAHGRPSSAIVAELLTDDRVAAGCARIEELEIERAGGVVALPGARELVESLPRRRWAIVTSCTRALALARMAELGVEPPLLVTADDISRGKPDPQPYLVGARRVGVDARRCVVVEDAPAGLASGRGAGAATVAVATSHPAGELEADVVVADLSRVWAKVDSDGRLGVWAGADESG